VRSQGVTLRIIEVNNSEIVRRDVA
jgi:hypothetical protein